MTKQTFILSGGRIIDPANERDDTGELWVKDGRIVAADSFARDKAAVIDVSGMIVTPGLVDIHVHFRDPGQTHKENIRSGSEAAAAGGFTTVVCMPNTAPVCDNAGTIRYILDRAASDSLVRIHPTGCLTKGMTGESMAPIGSLKKAGAVAVTDDGRCVQSNHLMRQIVTYARMFGLMVMDHCQDYSMTEGAVMNEGEWSLRLGLQGWPKAAEDIIVSRNIILSELTGAHIHMQHVSSAQSVELLREAKSRGIHVTGEASPHHIALTDACLSGYDPLFKMNPPLRTEEDRLALIEGLRDGTLDCLATDHAPHQNYEKDVELDRAPFGIIGLETAFPVVWQTLVRENDFTPLSVIDLLTRRGADLLGLNAGTLTEGAPADIAVFDPQEKWYPCPETLRSRSLNTPWLGVELTGRARYTFVEGRQVWPMAGG